MSGPSGYGGASPSTPPGRPILVSLLAIVIGILGFLVFLGGLLFLLEVLRVYSGGGLPPFLLSNVNDLTFLGILSVILGLILLGVAVGLWHLERWALYLLGLVLGIFIIASLIPVPQFSLRLVIYVLLLLYLIAVRHHFH
jgi:hypothetical protein